MFVKKMRASHTHPPGNQHPSNLHLPPTSNKIIFQAFRWWILQLRDANSIGHRVTKGFCNHQSFEGVFEHPVFLEGNVSFMSAYLPSRHL